jgi:hypothetical protein
MIKNNIELTSIINSIINKVKLCNEDHVPIFRSEISDLINTYNELMKDYEITNVIIKKKEI